MSSQYALIGAVAIIVGLFLPGLKVNVFGITITTTVGLNLIGGVSILALSSLVVGLAFLVRWNWKIKVLVFSLGVLMILSFKATAPSALAFGGASGGFVADLTVVGTLLVVVSSLQGFLYGR